MNLVPLALAGLRSGWNVLSAGCVCRAPAVATKMQSLNSFIAFVPDEGLDEDIGKIQNYYYEDLYEVDFAIPGVPDGFRDLDDDQLTKRAKSAD